MEIRWNTTYAEIDRGIKLKPAVNYWVDQLDNSLKGKKKAATTHKKKKRHISHSEWELLERLSVVLKDFYDATLDFSVSCVPTITKPLPLYKFLEQRLKKAIGEIAPDDDPHNLKFVLEAGLNKLNFYLKRSFESHFPLLGAVLHPSIRLTYFRDATKWERNVPICAETLLEHLYLEYAEDHADMSESGQSQARATQTKSTPLSIFDQAIAIELSATNNSNSNDTSAVKQSELATYFGGAYPCTDRNDPLGWWKVSIS
ncbi:hypothetical protein BU15DRAFT_55729 [Melanogaster broomeanus]|nr:hypothetical protein BU15DRAFT_55729 [Melanogaster broomeanus]